MYVSVDVGFCIHFHRKRGPLRSVITESGRNVVISILRVWEEFQLWLKEWSFDTLLTESIITLRPTYPPWVDYRDTSKCPDHQGIRLRANTYHDLCILKISYSLHSRLGRLDVMIIATSRTKDMDKVLQPQCFCLPAYQVRQWLANEGNI